MLRRSLTLGALLFLVSCKAPEPPTLEPERAEVRQVALTGVEVELTIEAKNPNSIPLQARKVKARVKVGDNVDLGEVSVDTKVKIPAEKSATIVAPLSLSWRDLGAVATLAATKSEVRFTVEGTAEIGTEDVNFDVPFKTEGTMSQQDLLKLGAGALPIPTALPKLPF